jgi:hypothetical protein
LGAGAGDLPRGDHLWPTVEDLFKWEQKFSIICLSNDGIRIQPWTLALRIADLDLADQMQEPRKRQIPAPKYEFVDLAESELIDKVGAYRMHGTRMIWGVAVVEGKLALTDRLGKTHRLEAVSPTRFRALESLHKGARTLVFERRSDKRFNMRLDGDDGSKVEFEPIQLVKPETKQLSEYAGQYDNGRIITFVRDGEKRITGFTIELWSIKGVSFEKRSARFWGLAPIPLNTRNVDQTGSPDS